MRFVVDQSAISNQNKPHDFENNNKYKLKLLENCEKVSNPFNAKTFL